VVGCPPNRAKAVKSEDFSMGKRSKTGVLKRLREVKKAEKAAHKREEMRERKESGVEETRNTGATLATAEDMEGYGFPVDDDESEQEEN